MSPGVEPKAPASAGSGAGPVGNSSDTAGVPWAGRTLATQPFAGDDGTINPALFAALQAWRHDDGVGLSAVVRAWAPARVLVPIVAVLGPAQEGEGGARRGLDAVLTPAHEHGQGDKNADMAVLTITAPDGRRILPTFSSTAALVAWNASARPVPVQAARAAQAAVVEGCDAVAIDPAGPVPCLLPRPAVWALAQGRDWLPPADDPELLRAVALIRSSVPGLAAHRCEPDGVAGLNVVLGLPPGLTPDDVHQLAAQVSELLAADPLIAERADSLRLTVRPV
jgi:hypothetical protein